MSAPDTIETTPSPAGDRAKRFWPLRLQLVLLCLSIAVPLVALLAYNLHRDFAEDERHAGAHGMGLAKAAADNAARVVEDARLMLVALAQRPAIRALDPALCDPLLAEIRLLYPRFANALVVNREGEPVCSAVTPPPGTRIRLDAHNIFDRLRASREFTVGHPAKGTITGRLVIMLAQPLLDQQGEFAGAVALPLDLLNFSLLPADFSLPKGAIAAIGTYEGMIIARSHDAENFVGRSTKEWKVRQAAIQMKSGQLEVDGIDGVRRVFGFTPVKGTEWYAVAGLPSSEVYAASRTNLQRSMLLALAILLFTAWLAYLASRRIERPIRHIAAAADAIAAGDETARAPLEGTREVVALGERFNAMLDSLAEADTERARLHSMIEQTSDIIVVAQPDRSISYMNLAGRALWGIGPNDSLEGYVTAQYYAPGENEKVLRVARPHAIAHGRWVGELVLISHEGRHFPVLHVLIALKNARDELTHFAGMSHDITERMQAEKRISEQLNELRRWYEATLNREDRVRELKAEINALHRRLGENAPYDTAQDR